jgi:hypothetical protein
MTDREPDTGAVWLRSEPDQTGTYHLRLELGPGDVVPLDTLAAYRWAAEVLAATAAAEHDAAVVAQLTALGVKDSVAAGVVTALRADRPGSGAAVPGLALVPGVSHRTRDGFVLLERHGEPFGQWDLDAARHHAAGVLEAVEVALLDATYLRALTGLVGLDRDRALAVVADLANHRPPQPADPDPLLDRYRDALTVIAMSEPAPTQPQAVVLAQHAREALDGVGATS